MELVFIKKIGLNFKGNTKYEFLFSDSAENVMDSSWTITPANGNVTIPIESVELSKSFTTELTFELLENSKKFSYFDAVEGVIAICWEDISMYTDKEIPTDRLIFNYGDKIDVVKDKLKVRGLVFDS